MLNGWFKQLSGDRIEVFLKTENEEGVPDLKVRASGPEAAMFELVDWFEERTGLSVDANWRRVRKGPRPLAGQLTIDEMVMV